MSTASRIGPFLSKYRLYVLAAVFGGMVLYYVAGESLWENLPQNPVEKRRQKLEQLNEAVEKREQVLAKARQAGRLLALWESQSLPSDTEVARSLYRAWLVELVQYVRLENPSVNSSQPASRGGLYYALPFSVRARGTLDQLTQFLFTFYSTDLLHQIRSLYITPLQNSDKLDLTMSIEALALPNAFPKRAGGDAGAMDQDAVVEEFRRRAGRNSDRLASPTLADYDPIGQRNLFGIGGSPDPIDHTYLTGVNVVDGWPEAWFTVRTDGKVLKLRTGQSLIQTGDRIRKLCRVDDLAEIRFDGNRSQIGTLAEIEAGSVIVECNGQRYVAAPGRDPSGPQLTPFDAMVTQIGVVAQIEGNDLILEADDGERWLLTLGENLTGASALPPER